MHWKVREPGGTWRPLGAAQSSWSAEDGGGDGAGGGAGGDRGSKGFARLSAFGRFATQQQMIGALANQMMLTAYLDDPATGDAIRARMITKPVVIIG